MFNIEELIEKWQELGHAAVDPRKAYWCNLPSGKRIALFFYDGRVAQDVAFNNLLSNGASLRTLAKAISGNTLKLAKVEQPM